jgi:hypothetical protein
MNTLDLHRATFAVIDALSKRKGFDAWWSDIDESIQDEIREAIAEAIDDTL